MSRRKGFEVATVAVVAAVLGVGCDSDGDRLVPIDPAPTLSDVDVAPGAGNVLSIDVSFRVGRADSARVRIGPPGGPESITPTHHVVDGEAKVTALGLLPDTDYDVVLEATKDGRTTRTAAMTVRTGTLPSEIETVRLQLEQGAIPGGYVLTSVGDYAIAFDTNGDIAWYQHIPDLTARQVGLTGTGNFFAFVGETRGWDPTFGYYLEFTPEGDEVARHLANAPLYTDCHDLMFTVGNDGRVTTHFFSYDIRVIDMSAYGGSAAASVAGHQILRFGPDGGLRFLWNAWDHLDIDDWVVAIPTPSCFDCDFDHPNSIDQDLDRNYVVSFRSLNEITCIESNVGTILWRLGGNHNEFTFVNDPFGGFSGQHMASILENGNLLLFDNGPNHAIPESRAVEYELDLVAKTATMVWSYEATPPIYTAFRGSAQRLDNGNTVVGFAGASAVHEVDSTGSVVWAGSVRQDVAYTGFYRALRIESLYDPK